MPRNHILSRLGTFACIVFIATSAVAQFSHEGFALGMIVHTNADPKRIEDIQIGDLVLSKDLAHDIQVVCPVTHISKELIPGYVEIVLDHETITTALGQKFYLEGVNAFVTAQELMQSPELQAQFPEAILEIRQVNEGIEIYKLTVAHEHNFYVTEKQLLAHNFIPMVTVVGVAVPSIVVPIAKGIAGAAMFGWIGSKFWKAYFERKKERAQQGKEKADKSKEHQKQGAHTKKDKGQKNSEKKKLKGKEKDNKNNDKKDKGGKKAGAGDKEKPKAEEGKKEPKDKGSKEAQAPGKPTEKDGFHPPKKWDGKKVSNPNGPGYGWPDKAGNIWIPSGPNGHGGPHWDVQLVDGGYENVVPGGRIRGEK